MALLDRFQARHREIESRLNGWAPDFSGLSGPWPTKVDMSSAPGHLLQTALGLPNANFTSWLRGVPLAALLVAGRRITVDIAPAFLINERPNYGLSREAMIEFGRAGMLLFNIRDFNPTASPEKQASDASAYEPWRDFIEQLLDEAWDSVYFLASIRPRVFDAIPDLSPSTPRLLLNKQYEKAKTDLSKAAAHTEGVPGIDADAVRAVFRDEKTHSEATFWHCAYVGAVDRFVDSDFRKFIRDEYDFLSNIPEKLSQKSQLIIGKRFLEFQTRMRFAHLIYSAPISASFGGPYGYSLNDDHIFMQAVERQFRWTEETPFEFDYFEDDLLDLVQDLQAGQLRPRFARHLNGRHWERLRELGSEVYARTEPISYFEHYQDPTNRKELVAYWTEWSSRRSSFANIDQEVETLIGTDDFDPQRVFELAGIVADERNASDRLLRKHCEGFQVRTLPPPGMQMAQDKVTATNPKHANLLLRALVWFGLKRTNGDMAVGKQGDYNRVAYGVSRNYRDNPR